MKTRPWISATVVAIIAIVLLTHLFSAKKYNAPETVIAWDVISYYSYLPATFIDHDITLSFVPQDTANYRHYWPEFTPEGKCVIKTTMGLSLLYCPFFLAAHALAAPLGYAANGFSPPYACAIMLACVFWIVVGCVCLRRVLLRHYSDITTGIVLAVTVLATNLFMYGTYEAAYSHGFSFGLICLFLILTEKWYERQTQPLSLAVGLCLGLITLIRPSNAVVALYFALYGITSWQTLLGRVQLFLRHWAKVLLMATATFAVWIPQIIYWGMLTGNLFYYSYGNERFFWLHPMLLKGLFGFRKGWLVYTPVMAFAMIGFVGLWKRHRWLFWPCMVFSAVNVYIVLSWWCWWYGGCFGQRALVDSYGIMALPMAAFVEWMLTRRRVVWRVLLIVLFAAVTFLSFFHHLQYLHGTIHHDSMTAAAYFDSFLSTKPSPRMGPLLDHPDYEAAKRGVR